MYSARGIATSELCTKSGIYTTEFSRFYLKSRRILYWEAESAQKAEPRNAESAQKAEFCTRRRNLHKRCCGRKTLLLRFSYLKTQQQRTCSSTRDIVTATIIYFNNYFRLIKNIGVGVFVRSSSCPYHILSVQRTHPTNNQNGKHFLFATKLNPMRPIQHSGGWGNSCKLRIFEDY